MFDPSKALKKMLGPRTNVPRFGKPTKFDFDGDGISNKRDCQARNPVRQDDYPFDQPLIPTGRVGSNSVWMGNLHFDSSEEAEEYRKIEGKLRGRITDKKKYGEHILIQDSKGNRYSTKNISPIGSRTIFDGDSIHGKNKKPDIIIDYEL